MKSRWIFGAISTVIGAITLIVFHAPILVQLALWMDVGITPRVADYVMVLPGGPERRPFVAAAMIKQGLVKNVLTAATETDPSNEEGVYPSTDQVLSRTLILRGVREDQIRVLPGRSNSTWTDAMALATFLRENPAATIAVVTDDFHTRRTSWTFRRVLGNDAKRIFFVSARVDRVSPHSWWTTEEGLGIYVGEYCKLLGYVATDRTNVMFIVFLLAVVGLADRIRRKWTQTAAPKSTPVGSVQSH